MAPLVICNAGNGPLSSAQFALKAHSDEIAASRVDSSVRRDAQTCDI